AARSRRNCNWIIWPLAGSYGAIMNSEYSAQPSTLTLLKANSERASDTPCSTIAENCNSWPGRPSCEVSVHAQALQVKSSYASFLPLPEGGLPSGSTKLP